MDPYSISVPRVRRIVIMETIWSHDLKQFQIRPDILLGLIWVQTVCKCYQQATKGGKKEFINCDNLCD